MNQSSEEKLETLERQLDAYLPILEERVDMLESANTQALRVVTKLMLQLFKLEDEVRSLRGEESGNLPIALEEQIDQLLSRLGVDWQFGKEMDGDS